MGHMSTQADRDLTLGNDGLFIGALSPEEIEAFDRCVKDGFAYRAYEGGAGFFGLAKVRWAITRRESASIINGGFKQ
jgi:hypothetical protein